MILYYSFKGFYFVAVYIFYFIWYNYLVGTISSNLFQSSPCVNTALIKLLSSSSVHLHRWVVYNASIASWYSGLFSLKFLNWPILFSIYLVLFVSSSLEILVALAPCIKIKSQSYFISYSLQLNLEVTLCSFLLSSTTYLNIPL